jgi:DNA-directed RNA polymerase subunit M/transcription elongation factor TFIIS
MSIVCPKCGKALIKRETTVDLNYWKVKCLWCGHAFRKAKTNVSAKDRRWIEGGTK